MKTENILLAITGVVLVGGVVLYVKSRQAADATLTERQKNSFLPGAPNTPVNQITNGVVPPKFPTITSPVNTKPVITTPISTNPIVKSPTIQYQPAISPYKSTLLPTMQGFEFLR